MNCPADGTVLAMTDRQGIEIDYCPTCRGVWLDRGELDKLIERSQNDDDDRDRDRSRERDRDREPEPRYAGKPRKKKSFLSEMFESFGD